jgi:Kinesin motor domain
MDNSYFNVGVRLKPGPDMGSFITTTNNSLYLYGTTEYIFDKVFNSASDNLQLFDFLLNTVNETLVGINASVIAYGERGSGKTHSIFGNGTEPGLGSLTASYLFNHFKQKHSYSCSMIIILQDKIIDLFREKIENQPLVIKKDAKIGVIVENLAEIVIEKENDCNFLINRGLKLKKLNKLHGDVVFQINIESEGESNLIASKINFCDLYTEKKNRNFQSLKSVLTCLSNNATVPYKDSLLTKFLSDTLNKSSNTTLISNIISIDKHLNSTIETLGISCLTKNISTWPKKNQSLPMSFRILKRIHHNIYSLKDKINKKQGKNLHEEVLSIKIETERLKEVLSQQTTAEDIEKIIKKNKKLKLQLQNLMANPIADIELPESMSELQKALVLTEDMIKKRKKIINDQEIKSKLLSQGRCTVCTLKPPCNHCNDIKNLDSISLPINSMHKSASSFYSQPQSPDKMRTRKGSNDYFTRRPSINNTFIEKTEKKIKVLAKIEAYREQKVLKEIERLQILNQIEKEIQEKKKKDEEIRKKHLENNKKKLRDYKMIKEKIKDSEMKPKKFYKKRTQSSVRISNYQEHKRSISEILKLQSKIFNLKTDRGKSSISFIDHSSESPYKQVIT